MIELLYIDNRMIKEKPMKKLILIITLLSACSTIQVKAIDYDAIKDPTYLSCVASRLQEIQRHDYIPTIEGYKSIKAGCYVYLKEAGVLR